MLTLRAKEGYKPTAKFISIYKPLSEDERKQALLACLKSPKIYMALLEQYNNNIVPNVVGLSTYLYRNHSIFDKASERAAQVFLDNLRDLDLLDADNQLSLELDNTDLGVDIEDTGSNGNTDLVATALKPKYFGQGSSFMGTNIAVKENLPLVISLKGDGRKAQVIYPSDMTNEDWEKVVRIIQAMKDI